MFTGLVLVVLRRLTLKATLIFHIGQWRCDVIIAHDFPRIFVVCCSAVTSKPEKACCVGNSKYVYAYPGRLIDGLKGSPTFKNYILGKCKVGT